ncbi:hypothetical protein [Chryseobacterium sp. c4a]|uniref:hypothetical protein n=1 Tax=Chryseobacterium sp. c4a TaxID=1573582 RepID=UPI001359594C|nr:hypothetical protein [Chryseobacterium sp. c4a]
MSFYGYKIHVVCSVNGVFQSIALSPASIHDIPCCAKSPDFELKHLCTTSLHHPWENDPADEHGGVFEENRGVGDGW